MIKVGIIGYGNLGQGVERAILKQNDMEVFGIFTRRPKETVKTLGATAYNMDELMDYKEDIDVLVHCGSSEFDLRDQTPELVKHFNIVNSFDMHALISEHIDEVSKNAADNKKSALVSVGWDPGIFSMQKTIFDAILVDGTTQSFWGHGKSQGHSNVASKVDGVVMARSYSVPNAGNIEKFKQHEAIDVSTNHYKDVYVVAKDGADTKQIEADIMNIEHYFKGSSTNIYFITQEEMDRDHNTWHQGGEVIRSAKTSENTKHTLDFKISLDSNPEFTSSVLVAYTRTLYRMHLRQEYGVFTALDIRPRDMSSNSYEQLIKEML